MLGLGNKHEKLLRCADKKWTTNCMHLSLCPPCWQRWWTEDCWTLSTPRRRWAASELFSPADETGDTNKMGVHPAGGTTHLLCKPALIKTLGHVHTAGKRPNIAFSPICNSYLSFYNIINVTNPSQVIFICGATSDTVYVFQGDLNFNGHADFIWLMSLTYLDKSRY